MQLEVLNLKLKRIVFFFLVSTAASTSRGFYRSDIDVTKESLCSPGHYCIDGIQHTCPAGSFNEEQGSYSIKSCKPCLEGYYCPIGSVRATQIRCGDASVYCPAGSASPLQVPSGYYSTVGGRSTPSDWPRPLETDTSLVESEMGLATLEYVFSKENTGNVIKEESEPLYLFTPRLETIIDLTKRSIGTHVRTTIRKCIPGTYCLNGIASLCSPGLFGSEAGLSSPLCSGSCESGFYCPAGSVSPFQHRCFNESYFCPVGVGFPISVTNGYYSASGRTTSNGGRLIASTLSMRCDANYTEFVETSGAGSGLFLHEPAAGRSEHPNSECVESHENDGSGVETVLIGENSLYFDEEVLQARYAVALATGGSIDIPQGTTEVEYFANIDGSRGQVLFTSNIPQPMRNGPRSLSDDRNSFRKSLSNIGLEYLDIVSKSITSSDGQVQFGGGKVPLEDRRSISDTISPAEGLHVAGSSIIRTKTVDKQPCKVPRSPLYSAYRNVTFSQWRYCYGSNFGDEDTRSKQIRCEVGSFCWRGLRFECPPGFYGALEGESRFECSNECPSGYFCSWGSTKPTECGGVHLYCPKQSGAPTPIDIGHYSDEGEPENKKTRQFLCEPGYYCINGTRFKCSAGRFGSRFGLHSPHCSGECSPGFFCPSGSSLPTQVQCGFRKGSSVFCPAGSSKPLPVSLGSYTRGGYENIIGLSSNNTRTFQVPCEPGHYCIDGIKRQCPQGKFGNESSLSSELCSGLCAPGHFCPPGSISQTEFRCGELFLFLVDVLLAVPAQSEIQANLYNNSDYVPLTDPKYDYKELYFLYKQLSSSSSLSGVIESGAWKELTDTEALLKVFDPTGSGDAAAGGMNSYIRAINNGESLYYNATSGYLQFRKDINLDGFPNNDANFGAFLDRYSFSKNENFESNVLSPSSSIIKTGADSLYYYDLKIGTASRNGTIYKPQSCGPLSNMSFETSTILTAEKYRIGNSTGSSINATDYECSILSIGQGEAEHMLEPTQISLSTDSLLRVGMDGSIVLQLVRVGPVNFTAVAVKRVADIEIQIQQELDQTNDLLTDMIARGESDFEINNIKHSSTAIISKLNVTLAHELRNLKAWGWWGITARGTDVLSQAGEANATVLNYTISIPWRAGVRFRLPPMIIPLPSFSSTMRHLLQGGPSSVYCPVGSGWPKDVPVGWYTTTSELAQNASKKDDLEALLMGFSRDERAYINSTRDGISKTEPGFYSIAGIRRPCPPGYFGSTHGLSNRACSGYCPAGFECPLNTSLPISCRDGTYATGGNDNCIPCPIPKALEAPLYPIATSLPIDSSDPLMINASEIAKMKGGVIPLTGAPNTPVLGSAKKCTTSRQCCGLN
jgi:hypothetical protein